MNRIFVGTLGAVVMSAAVLAAQDKSGPAAGSSPASGSTVTFTGCLEPGSSAGHYTLVNAKQKDGKSKDKVSLTVVPGKLKLDGNVSQEVEITGTITTGSGGASKIEGGSELSTLTATKLKFRADSCG